MKCLGAAVAALLVLLSAACAELPEAEEHECGNRVMDQREDCDTFGIEPNTKCLPPGTSGACHFTCSLQANGDQPVCPAGWGCDPLGICHRPTDDYEVTAQPSWGTAFTLASADFDGDGRADLVSSEPPDPIGRRKLSFHYFGRDGDIVESHTFPKLLSSPLIRDISNDGRADLVFSDFRVGMLLGRADRKLVPEAFSSFHVADSSLRTVSVNDAPVKGGAAAFLSFTVYHGVPGIYAPRDSGILRIGELSGPVESLSGDPVAGNLIEDTENSPCLEVLFAMRGESEFELLDSCTRDDAGSVIFRDQVISRPVRLSPPAPIDGPLQIADLNGDGHLDAVLSAGGLPYFALGDGTGLGTAVAVFSETLPVTEPFAMPLAAGDFSGDGIADFVFSDHLVVSLKAGLYRQVHPNLGVPWTVAQVADFDGDGRLDVIAASENRLGLDLFKGMPGGGQSSFNLPSRGPVKYIAVGDFDGDSINDIAFLELLPSDPSAGSLMMAFGEPAGPPRTPVEIARLSNVEAITVYTEEGLASLLIISHETVEGKNRGALTLLIGSGDRLPYAPYELTSFASNGSLQSSLALALTAGAFSARGNADVLALASEDPWLGAGTGFWLLPALQSSGTTPLLLEGELDPRLHPTHPAGIGFAANVSVASADIDRDGRDEAIWAMPADDGERCGMMLVGTSLSDRSKVVVRNTLFLDQPCANAQLLAVDADADDMLDIALLTGGEDSGPRELLVLWNRGGNFDQSEYTRVSATEDSPQQFTVLPATLGHGMRFVYTSARGVLKVTSEGDRRFSEPQLVEQMARATGVVAADVNGDGVIDLTVAAGGELSVLKARLLQ